MFSLWFFFITSVQDCFTGIIIYIYVWLHPVSAKLFLLESHTTHTHTHKHKNHIYLYHVYVWLSSFCFSSVVEFSFNNHLHVWFYIASILLLISFVYIYGWFHTVSILTSMIDFLFQFNTRELSNRKSSCIWELNSTKSSVPIYGLISCCFNSHLHDWFPIALVLLLVFLHN